MHLHEKPKGRAAKNPAAGQPCKIGECNPGDQENNLASGCQNVVSANAGDGWSYRFRLACSAELCAASASLAEIAAVSAWLPQLGASLPLPHARGR